MPKKTILLHEDSSKETWKTPKTEIKRKLRELGSIKNFSLKYKTDSYGTLMFGKLPKKKSFGIAITKEF